MEQKCTERDYTAELKSIDDGVTAEDEALVKKLFSRLEHLNSLPHIVDPLAVQRFEEMVEACDLIAKEFSGKLKATVDYERYSARIELECVYIDFDQGEFLETLQKLTAMAGSISFQPLTSGFLRVEIAMPYFLTVEKKHTSI